jgi:type IV pilus assembly protein PilC
MMQITGLSLFYLELSRLLSAGLPIDRALTFLQERASKAHQKIIARIQQQLRAGFSLSEAFLEHPRYFSALQCEMIRMGEATGKIAAVFQTLSAWSEQEVQFREQCRKALFYPTLTLFSALLMLLFLSQVMLPSMAALYTQFHQALPPSTQQFLALSDDIKTHGIMIILSSAFVFSALYSLLHFSARMKIFIHRLMYHTPGMHAFYLFMLSYHLSTQLSLLLKHHVPLLQALTFAERAQKNSVIQDKIRLMQTLLLCGSSFSEAVEESKACSSVFIGCIKTGEEIGDLPYFLETARRYHEARLTEYGTRFTAWIEPISLSLMSVFIGWIAYSFYQPLLSLHMF